jgi:hypothetical protein
VDAARVVEWAKANQDKLNNVHGLDHKHQGSGAEPMLTFVIPGDQTYTRDGTSHHIGVMPTVKLCIYRQAVRLQGNVEINPLDPKALTAAEVQGLYGALAHLQYLKETVPGFENAFVVAQNHLGVRETRRIVGDTILTIDHVKNQVRFDDVVALNCRGLDYHLKGTLFKWSPVLGHHDIPLRALLPQGVDNLLVAGRCISCDHLSQASLRGAATCLATGHAAGTAAALASQEDKPVRKVDIHHIQETLVAQDAILGTGDRAKRFARS